MFDINKVISDTVSTEPIQALFSSLKEFVGERKGRESQRFHLEKEGKRMCFILYSGTCVVRRTYDSLVLSTITAPSIIGLYDIFHPKPEVQICAVVDIQYGMVKVDTLLDFIEKQQLWKNVSYMLMLSTTRFSEYQQETVGISNYELICNMLISLSNENFDIRASTTALEYIRSRSNLSRSGIMKTLSELRVGGYVVIKKGLLIKINSLPRRF